jgi:hypothetical protein
LAKPALNVGKGAVSLLATLSTIFALVVLFLLESPEGAWQQGQKVMLSAASKRTCWS